MAHYEPGRYNCRITSHGIDQSKTKQTPFVYLRFVPEGGDYERDVKLWLTTKTVSRTIERLRSLGWNGDRFADLGQHSFSGQVVELFCTWRHDNGQDYEDWDFPAPASASEAPKSNDQVARRLDALFGSELKKTGTPAAAPAATEPEDDSDIPF